MSYWIAPVETDVKQIDKYNTPEIGCGVLNNIIKENRFIYGIFKIERRIR